MQLRPKTYALATLSVAVSMALSGCILEQDTTDKSAAPEWELVWSDEFDGTELDRSKWSHEENCWGGGNNEKQCYVDSAANAYVEDGILHIKAIRGEHTGPVYNPDHAEHATAGDATLPFTSARLRSVSPMAYVEGEDPAFNFRNDWKYGRFEIRAKLPEGQGTWPAIWMLPTDWVYGGWAASGEIDIMEAVNLKTPKDDGVENHVHGTLHFGKAWPDNKASGVSSDFGDPSINPADDFHTYALEWEEGEIRWYVDDVHYATQRMDGWFSHYQDEEGNWQRGEGAAPFNQEFHLIMNLAMGGNWPGAIDETIQEQAMLVDFVRVYQCSANADTGKGCATLGEDAQFNKGVTEPPFPVAIDTSGDALDLFSDELIAGIGLGGWDPEGNDTRQVEDGVINFLFAQAGTNAYLEAGLTPFDMTEYAGGYLTFKMKVVSGDAESLTVKLDSGYPALAPLELDKGQWAAMGDWQEFSIYVPDFIDAGTNGFDITKIKNPLVFEPTNPDNFHIQLDDISFSKGEYDLPEPEVPQAPTLPLSLHEGSLAAGYSVNLYHGWQEDGDADAYTDAGGVISVTHVNGGNIALGIPEGGAKLDFSNLADGVLEFDLKVVSLGTAGDIQVKMDSGWPYIAALNISELAEGLPVAGGDFVSYSIPVQDFVAVGHSDADGSFTLDEIVNAIVFEATGGGSLAIDFKNVRFVQGANMSLHEGALAAGLSVNLYHGWQEDGDADAYTDADGVISVTHVNGGNIALGIPEGGAKLDLANLANSVMKFDLKVVSLGSASDIQVKMDSGWPYIAALNISELAEGLPVAGGGFVSYSIPVQDFVAVGHSDADGSFTLAEIVNAIVFEATGGGSLAIEFKNVRFEAL